jgi:hypothetical protein
MIRERFAIYTHANADRHWRSEIDELFVHVEASIVFDETIAIKTPRVNNEATKK